MQRGQAGRTVFETLLITSLVGILLVFAVSNFLTSVRLIREVALRSELGNIRTAINIYRVMNRRYPDTLRAMIVEKYIFPAREDSIIKQQYLEHMSVDKDGNLLDTFGNPFVFNEKIGRVRSSTRGYESW